MKAITIIQPWASLVVLGAKLNETRSWKTDYRGEILIHAGKKNFTHKLILDSTKMRDFLSQAGIIWGDQKKLPTGAIIGKAVLSDCVLIDQTFVDKLSPQEFCFGDYTLGRYAWVMRNAVLFDKPIPAKGMLGLWNWEEKI